MILWFCLHRFGHRKEEQLGSCPLGLDLSQVLQLPDPFQSRQHWHLFSCSLDITTLMTVLQKIYHWGTEHCASAGWSCGLRVGSISLAGTICSCSCSVVVLWALHFVSREKVIACYTVLGNVQIVLAWEGGMRNLPDLSAHSMALRLTQGTCYHYHTNFEAWGYCKEMERKGLWLWRFFPPFFITKRLEFTSQLVYTR